VRLLFFSLLFSLGSFICIGQEKSDDAYYSELVKNRLEFQMDNDFPFATDRYYTTGSFISYRRLLKNKNCDACQEQASVSFQHVFFTPTERESDDVTKFDRPYAGFLGLTGTYTIVSESNLIDLSVQVGVTGKISGAEGFQNLFHSSGGIGRVVSWTDQISNAPHLNFNTKYVKEWKILNNPLGLHIAYSPEFAIGTKDVFFKQYLALYLGKRNPMVASSAYNQLGEFTNELFIDLHVSHSYVAHNATLEGSLVGKESPFVLAPRANVWQVGASLYHRRGQNDFKVGVTYETPETENAEKHMYLGITYSRSF
jgi:lipid A 3-O-deacylase